MMDRRAFIDGVAYRRTPRAADLESNMNRPLALPELIGNAGKKLAESKAERERWVALARRRRRPSQRRRQDDLAKSSLGLNKEIQKRRRRSKVTQARKMAAIRHRRVLRSVCIEGKYAKSYAQISRVFEEFRKEGGKIPPRPSTPENAHAVIASLTDRPLAYQKSALRLISNPDTHALDFRRKSPWRAAWILSPVYIALPSTPWTVNSALNALRIELHWGSRSTTIDLFDMVVQSGDLDESKQAELLRRYWALIVELDADGDLNFDDEYDVEWAFTWPMIGLASYVIAHAFSTEHPDAQGIIEDVVDLFSSHGMEHLFHKIIEALLLDSFGAPVFSNYDGLAALILYFHSYIHRNEAATIAYRRIAKETTWADTVAGEVIKTLDWGHTEVGRPPAEETMGRWFSPELRGLLASHLIGGVTFDDEVKSFGRVLASGDHDSVNGPTASLNQVLLQILDDHDSLDDDVQKTLVSFMVPLDGKVFLQALGALHGQKLALLVRALSNELQCGRYLSRLKDLCNPQTVSLESAGNASARRGLARLSRGIAEAAVKQIDDSSWHNDDDIMMKAFSNSQPDTLMWLTRATLTEARKILDEGWTGGDEQDLMDRCSQAIGRIDAGQGSGSF